MTESGVAPSSSASARNVRRCRSTGRATSRTSSGVEKSRPRIAESAFEQSSSARKRLDVNLIQTPGVESFVPPRDDLLLFVCGRIGKHNLQQEAIELRF